MQLRGAEGRGRASLRRRRPWGPRPKRPRARCGRLLPPPSGVFVRGGVGGKAQVRTAPPSARALRGQVGAKKKKKYQVKYLWTPLV